jgi:hypothetical protein
LHFAVSAEVSFPNHAHQPDLRLTQWPDLIHRKEYGAVGGTLGTRQLETQNDLSDLAGTPCNSTAKPPISVPVLALVSRFGSDTEPE